METKANILFIVDNNYRQLIDEIKTHLNDLKFDVDRSVTCKCFSQIEELYVSDEELIQVNTIVIIGASVSSIKQFNQRIRINQTNDNLRLIFANIGQISTYLFTDYGPNARHLSFNDYSKTMADTFFVGKNHSSSSLEAIICGLICGQLLSTRKQSNQMFFQKIDSQTVEYKFATDRPVVVIGLGSLGFAMVKQLVRVGAKNMILIDSDSVHKYNLRHNLFNESQIGLKKCDVVKEYVLSLNKEIGVEAFCARAQQASTKFFVDMTKAKAVIMSAVDNIETKRFLNKVCLNHCLPFIDVGIDGHMFHIQPIVPHLTESYFTYSDASDPDYPLCVLKSFPQMIEHCVQWSKNKFENWFNKRAKRSDNWIQCLQTSRLIFEKFFNRKAKQLLFSIPLDRKDENGLEFWSDKQPPHPLTFDLANDSHKSFLILCAQLIATVNNVDIEEDSDLCGQISSFCIPEFVGKCDKMIITDPSVTQTHIDVTSDFGQNDGLKRLNYCRDNDKHLKFIHILTNLRAEMYDIQSASISQIDRIYNQIIDCFGFTLSTASAMASIELIKLCKLEGNYHLNAQNIFNNVNHFYNLSDLDVCVDSLPERPNKIKLSNTCYFTEWDQWLLNESEGMSTLEDILNELRVKSGSVCTMMVMDDSKSIYLPDLFPHHLKRKKQSMRDIIANYYSTVPPFVTLSVSFESEDEEISGPNIKYNFTQN